MRRQLEHIARALLLLLLAAAFSAGCKEKKPDPQPTEKRTAKRSKDPIKMGAPTPEELANSPCGNSDWAKLPNGMDPEKAKPEGEGDEAE